MKISIDEKKERIAELQQQLTMLNFAASQAEYTENFIQGLDVTSIPVYQRTPFYAYSNCGCGMARDLIDKIGGARSLL